MHMVMVKKLHFSEDGYRTVFCMACRSSSEWKASAMVAQVCRQLHIRQGSHIVAMTAERLQVRVCDACKNLQRSLQNSMSILNVNDFPQKV